jgi:hypothetical protein
MEQINDQIKEFLKQKGSNNWHMDNRKSNNTEALGYIQGEIKEDYKGAFNNSKLII